VMMAFHPSMLPMVLALFYAHAAAVIDLATVTSPYVGSTTSNVDSFTTCGSGAPDAIFSYTLRRGEGIMLSQRSNNFDSVHTLRYGGGYPGSSEVPCVDSEGYLDAFGYPCSSYAFFNCTDTSFFAEHLGYTPDMLEDIATNCPVSCRLCAGGCANLDKTTLSFVNTGTEDLPVYFVVDGYQDSAGDFEVEWRTTVYAACDATELLPHAAGVGDCVVDLPHGASCTQAGVPPYTCTSSTCRGGVNSAGTCYKTCDMTALLPHAAGVGSCSVEVPHGGSCTQAGDPGFICTSSTCHHGRISSEGMCYEAVVDLTTRTSPYAGSTVGKRDTMATCGYSTGAPDQGFRYVLQPGEGIALSQTSPRFDSVHMLRYGGVYPGDAEHVCADDPDDATMTFGNTGDAEVAVYFVVDGYYGGIDDDDGGGGGGVSSGEFTLEWQILVTYAGACDATELLPKAAGVGDCVVNLPHGASCTQAGVPEHACGASSCQHGIVTPGMCYRDVIQLDTVTSPYAGSTTGKRNRALACGYGDGPEQSFAHLIRPGQGIAAFLASSSFNSVLTLRYGGLYPGEAEHACVNKWDDGNTKTATFENTGDADVAVYLVVDGYGYSDSGEFSLEWAILTSAAACDDATDLLPHAAGVGSCVRDLPHGASCTQTGAPGYTCTPSTCRHGNLHVQTCYKTTCDATELLSRAAGVGSCVRDVPHGASCTQTGGAPDYTCTPSTCSYGRMSEGTCYNRTALLRVTSNSVKATMAAAAFDVDIMRDWDTSLVTDLANTFYGTTPAFNVDLR
jgi:hypothetical protein